MSPLTISSNEHIRVFAPNDFNVIVRVLIHFLYAEFHCRRVWFRGVLHVDNVARLEGEPFLVGLEFCHVVIVPIFFADWCRLSE